MKPFYSGRVWFGAIAVLLAAAVLSLWASRQVAGNAAWQKHTMQVLAKAQDVLAHLQDAETGQRGYLLTGELPYLQPYSTGVAEIRSALGELRRLTRDNASQQAQLDALEPVISRRLDLLQKTIELHQTGNAAAAHATVKAGEGRALMDSIRSQLADFRAKQTRLLEQRNAAFESSIAVLLATIVATAAIAVLVLGAFAFRLHRVGERVLRLAAFQRALLDSADAAIISTTPEGVINSFNRGAERLLGYGAAEVVGTRTPALWHDPDEVRTRAEALTREIGTPIEPGFDVFAALPRQHSAETREWTYIRRDGTRVPVLLSVTPIQDERGTLVGFLGIARDISERKQVEQALALERDRLELALTSSNLAMWEFDLRAGRISLDERWGAMLGGAAQPTTYSADALLGLVPAEDRQRILAAISDLTAGRSFEYRVEHRVRGQDGDLRWVESRGKVVERDTEGHGLRMIGTNADITERKHAEAALVSARDQAHRANLAKDTFLATMSHEMRTSLNGLLGMLELVALMGLNEEQAEAVGIARDSGHSLLRIIDDVLDHAKMDAGKLSIQPEPVSISTLVQRVANTYHALASTKDLVLKQWIDPQISPALLADPVRVMQILGNFVSNAIKFTAAGFVEIRAALVRRTTDGETVRFSVKDTGIGISLEAQQRLFQPFEQAGASTSRLHGGTGLGLAISRRLAEMMGGTVEMESATDQGTTMCVTLTFPVSESGRTHQGGEGAQPDGARMERSEVAPIACAQRCTALVVDDNPTNRLLLKRQLAMLGLHADTASDGKEALARWRDGDYDLVITDCNMPEMDGYALSRNIRAIEAQESRPRRPVIGWTANVLARAEAQCKAAGMDDLLPKPSGIRVVRESVEHWLQASGSRAPAPPNARAGSRSTEYPTGDEPLDPRVLDEITGGDEDMAREVLHDFRERQLAAVGEIEKALGDGDFALLQRASHRLKGAARTVGATELAATCESIETAAADRDGPALAELRTRFTSAAARTMHALAAIS